MAAHKLKADGAHFKCVGGPLVELYLPWPREKIPPKTTLPSRVPLPGAGTYVRRYSPEDDTSYYQYQETPVNAEPTRTATARVVHRGTRVARPQQQISNRPVGTQANHPEDVVVRNPDNGFGDSGNLVAELSESASRTYGAARHRR